MEVVMMVMVVVVVVVLVVVMIMMLENKFASCNDVDDGGSNDTYIISLERVHSW